MAFVDYDAATDTYTQANGYNHLTGEYDENNIDTFVMGDDWTGKFDFLKEYCDVVYLPRTPEISTTQIKQELGKA